MSNAVDQPKAFSVSEVARLIGRTELATRRAIERGQIPSRKWGHRVVVLADELDAFLRGLPAREGADGAA
jgi:excisionase family DNA binding protein